MGRVELVSRKDIPKLKRANELYEFWKVHQIDRQQAMVCDHRCKRWITIECDSSLEGSALSERWNQDAEPESDDAVEEEGKGDNDEDESEDDESEIEDVEDEEYEETANNDDVQEEEDDDNDSDDVDIAGPSHRTRSKISEETKTLTRKCIAYVDEEDGGEEEEAVTNTIVAEQVLQPTNVHVLPLTITELLFIF